MEMRTDHYSRNRSCWHARERECVEYTGALRLYSRVPQCEIRKIDVNCIDFSCSSPESNNQRGINSNSSLGAVLRRHFEESWFCRPKVRIANPHIARGSGTQRAGYRPTRALHATVPSSSGPARKHTAKFEPAAWSLARMTSGFGAPKRILSEEAFTFKV